MLSGRGITPPEKTLYWWSVHLDRFLSFCRKAGPETSAVAERATKAFLTSIAGETDGEKFAAEQARMALDVFLAEVENWRWGADRFGRLGPMFRLKTATGRLGAELGEWAEDGGEGEEFLTEAADSFEAGETFLAAGGEGVGREVSVTGSWLEQARRTLRVRHYALRTEDAYVQWMGRFLRWWEGAGTGGVEEADAGAVRRFLEYLAVERSVSASTQNQAFSALLFFFGEVLKRPLDGVDAVRAKRPGRLPVVLSVEEVRRLLTAMEGTMSLIARLLYGSGMRLMEVLRLRVKDVDFDRHQILVRDGNGGKDRVVMFPEKLREPLRVHLERVLGLYEADRAAGVAVVWLPEALGVKFPNAGKQWPWQWVFPSKSIGVDPRGG